MGSSQSAINNDPRNSLIDVNSENAVNRNQALIEQVDQEANIVVGQPKVKKTLAIKNPVYLKKSTLAFEKDGEDEDKLYIKFSYDSLVEFKLNFLFQATSVSNSNDTLYEANQSIIKAIQLDGRKGFKIDFLDKTCFVSKTQLKQALTSKLGVHDLVIEMIPLIKTADPLAFYTICSITEESNNLKIKGITQRLRAQGLVMEVNEIFNSMRESGECVICFEKNSNTILLPCKHSCCSSCAHGLRMRNLACPICKQSKR